MAASQRYEELNPGVRIRWEKRTLDEFGHKPIDQLARDFDLIVIDHPWAAFCLNRKVVLDLKPLLSESQWTQLSKEQVGASFESYVYNDQLLAIPIDAAAPAPSWRSDLMAKAGIQPPEDWQALIALADEKKAIMPGFDADLFLNWLMLLHALQAHPFESPDTIADKQKGIEAAALLKRLAESMPKEVVDWNPIRIAEMMTRTDDFLYCPFAYTYNNYARSSFVPKPLTYGNLPLLNGRPLRSILGGTGIALSAGNSDVKRSIDFALFCADARLQRTIYFYSGGQPSHIAAWENDALDAFSGGFFSGSLITHATALVRPRYDGFVDLQKQGGAPLQQFIQGAITEETLWHQINVCYRKSRVGEHEI